MRDNPKKRRVLMGMTDAQLLELKKEAGAILNNDPDHTEDDVADYNMIQDELRHRSTPKTKTILDRYL